MAATTALVSNRLSINNALKAKKEVIATLLPAGVDPQRFMQIAYQCIANNPDLMDCSPESIIMAVSQGAQLGLSFDKVLGQGFIIPYGKKAEFMIGYRGLIQLAYRSERIVKIYSEIVHDKDEFEIVDGTEQRIVHRRRFDIDRANEDEWKGAYAVAVTREGVTFSVFLTASDIMSRKLRSKSAKAAYSPWKSDPAEMWKKCPIRALSKVLPLSAETEPAIRAAIEDEYRDAGVEMPSAPELPPGAIEVEPATAAAVEEKRAEITVIWTNDRLAYVPMMPAALVEQRQLKDYSKWNDTKGVKRWELPAECVNEFAEWATNQGWTVKEQKAVREPGE